MSSNVDQLVAIGRKFSQDVDRLRFASPVAYVYNPLDYAWKSHEQYLRRYGAGRKRIVFLGMNPGPFGMAQTGVPFGEIPAVRDWLGICEPVGRPAKEHPKRPVQGFDCPRSEVSGRRLWKLFAKRFGPAKNFFADHFVANYCPLTFMTESGANITPDKLTKAERAELYEICDGHLRHLLEIMEPEWLIGVGGFAKSRGELVAAGTSIRIGQILHPSPASPKANRTDWTETAAKELEAMGVWPA